MAKKKSKHPKSSKKGGSRSGEDVFIDWVMGTWEWAKDNSQTVTVAGVVVALGLAAGLYYFNYRQDLNRQAAQEFEQVQQVVGTGQTETAQSELRSYLERFGDTPYAAEARILLAQTQLRAGSPGEAVGTLEPQTRDLDDPVHLQAAFLLGVAYEEAGRWEDAEGTYLRIADEAEMTFQVREALAHAARVRARQEDFGGAAALYRRVLSTFDEASGEADAQTQAQNTQERSLYRLRLAEMEAAADDASPEASES